MDFPFLKNKPFDIVGIGRNSWDRIVLVDQYPKADTKVEVLEVAHQSGGQAATTLVAATRLGAKTRYLGKFGDDAAGRAVRGALAREGIDLLGSKVMHSVSNQISFIVVDQKHQTRNVFGHCDSRLRIHSDDFRSETVISGKILFVGGRYPSDMISFAKAAKKEGILVVVDADTIGEGLPELLPFCDVVISPEAFPTLFTKEKNLKSALKLIFQMGPTLVCCTLGAKGAIAYDGIKFTEEKSPKIKTVDTTGAGDVFQGAFLVGLLRKKPLPELLHFACSAAALKCMHIGGQKGIPNQKILNQYLKKQ